MKRYFLYIAVIFVGSFLGQFLLRDLTLINSVVWLAACWGVGHLFYRIDQHIQQK